MERRDQSDDEWKSQLSAEQYRVLRQKGTEPAFSGEYWNTHGAGSYRCAGCGLVLFRGEAKFDSGTGWPSFRRPADEGQVELQADHSLGMARVEVTCTRCGGHLGHQFDDGPPPEGKRFCINSAALLFDPGPDEP